MNGPAGVMALVMAETMAGLLALVWLTPLWGEVKHGFYKVAGGVALLLATATWISIAAATSGGSTSGVDPAVGAIVALINAIVCTVLILAWLILLFVRYDRTARVLGIVTLFPALNLLIGLAMTSGSSWPVAFFQLLAGSAFLGAVMAGLLTGHWYLTDRKLTRVPINRFVVFLLVGVGLEAVAVIIGGFGPAATGPSFNPLLTGVASWIAFGMVVVTGAIAFLARATLKGDRSSAVQAATGFFYLAVVTAFAGELAAKVGFFS